ncbi:MAG TPA: ATP-binding protein [Chloroflexota bacterium]
MRFVAQLLAERLRFLWNGPDDLPRSLKLEWRLVAVRWLGIACLAPVLLLAHLPLDRLAAAYAVLIIASVYNAGLQHVIPRRPQVLANGYISTLGDALLDIAMVIVGGGFDSPFYFILFTVTLAAAMRYGYGPSLGVALLYVSADGIGYLISQQPVGAPFVVRSLLLPLTTVLAGYLREQAQQAEAALQERLRQSNALNEVTGILGASLELDAVLRAAVGATAQLFGTPTAVLQASSGLDGHSVAMRAPIFYAGDGQTVTERALEALCNRYAKRGLSSRTEGDLISVDRLPTGEQAIVLELALPTRQISLATLAVAVPPGSNARVDSDILDSFVERITLAVENASLYRTLADRSQDLQRAYSDLATAHQELLSVDEMKTNFLANVSHELRTPLTSIRSFSELLLAYEDDPSVQKEFLRIISTESERLTRLVNDVLDISRIEAGHMDWKMEPIDTAELLRDLGRTFSPLVSLAQLEFEVDVDENLAAVHGDRDRLHQVMANLLNNAMKFTRPGGKIVLRGELADDEVRVSVTDTGIGVASLDQERIFEKFQQVGDTLTDKPRGTGLGLAICRDIVEHHQGRLWIDSMPGMGSTFSVALPPAAETFAELAQAA